VLSKTPLSAVTSVPATELMLDDEVQDNHTGAEQIALARKLRAIATINRSHLWYITNALDQAVATENGLTRSSVDAFCAEFDFCGILVTDFSLANPNTVTHSLLAQEAMWTSPPYGKLIVDYGIGTGPQGRNVGGTTIADAQTIRHYIETQHLAGWMIFATKSGTVRGGPSCRPTEQIVAIMSGISARCARGS
jgi:hypothetical protein